MPTIYILILTVALVGAWIAFNYFRLKKAATFISNGEFEKKMKGAQVIDLRDPASYHKKHILGARNIPYEQLKQSLAAIRKDKPILLYENDRGQRVTAAALYLKKQGYQDIYILSYGINAWDGKVKQG